MAPQTVVINGGKVVIVGDRKQIGPVITGTVAQEHSPGTLPGLGIWSSSGMPRVGPPQWGSV
eukprot:6936079-Pyramimonas_sp.AAC.1